MHVRLSDAAFHDSEILECRIEYRHFFKHRVSCSLKKSIADTLPNDIFLLRIF